MNTCLIHDVEYDEELGCPGCWHDYKVEEKLYGDDKE